MPEHAGRKAACARTVEDIADRVLCAVGTARSRAPGERRFVELGLARGRGRAVVARSAGVGELVGPLVVLVPAGVVTVTSTVPAPRGDVAVMLVALLTVKVAPAVPKLTAVAPLKAVPVKVTEVPPAAGPRWGRWRSRWAPQCR